MGAAGSVAKPLLVTNDGTDDDLVLALDADGGNDSEKVREGRSNGEEIQVSPTHKYALVASHIWCTVVQL